MATMKRWEVCCLNDQHDEETVTVDAHQLTIEPSGSLSFWAVTNDNMQAVLLFAFGDGSWTRVRFVDIVAPEKEKT